MNKAYHLIQRVNSKTVFMPTVVNLTVFASGLGACM